MISEHQNRLEPLMIGAFGYNPILAFLGGIGQTELFTLLLLPLGYVLPIWMVCRKYGEVKSHWWAMAILAVLLFSWIGYILISGNQSGTGATVKDARDVRNHAELITR
jgi:hypothetical protein